jgi:AcrR family transcriptional regulator
MAKSRARKPTRVRRSAEDAQRLILDAAEKRLREGGPEAIRLQDIARDVGISHPAILHHFASRDGLTQALERRAMGRLEAELVEVLSSQPARGETAVDVMERAFATLGDAGHARMLAWRVLQAAPAEPKVDQQLLRALADLLHARRVEAATAERRTPPSPQDTEFVVRLTAAAMLGDGIFRAVPRRELRPTQRPHTPASISRVVRAAAAWHTGAER